METTEKIDTNRLKPFHRAVHREADGIIKYFVFGYFLFGLLLSIFHSTWGLGLIMGGISVGLYYLSRSLFSGRLVSRMMVSFLLWNFPLQFILQMRGSYEMHFFFFVSLTILLFYEEWRILVPMIAYAALSYGVLFYLNIEGSTLMENAPSITAKNMAIHFGILTFYSAICIVWAKLQKKHTSNTGISQINLKQQLSLMDTNISFANDISQGNLNAEYSAEKADRLGKSLMNMRDSLVEASERETKEKFVNVGLASIGEILRNNTDNLEKLCDQVIAKLVNYMKANQGGIFIINEDENTNDTYLDLMACRAYDRKKFLEKRINLGQGLIGQAAVEKQTIYMLDLPEDYINITSGLGLATPNCLLIVPLKSNDEIVGVIELASFEEFDQNDIEFMEKVGESIAATVISAKTNQTTKELLEQSNQMTEEMKAQEEEMRQNMEEMQATQEEMARTQKELADKEANLDALINNTSDSIITIDRDYKLLVMNSVAKDRYKGTQFEGVKEGSNALDILGDLRDEWKGYYDRAMSGESLDFTLQNSGSASTTWREYYINPIKAKSGSIIGASVFSRDVTEKKKMELELKNKGFVFEAMINNGSDTYFAIDNEYRILVANNVIRERYKDQNISFDQGEYIFDKLPNDLKEIWKERYDKVLAGENLSLEESKTVNGKSVHMQVICDPIQNDEGEIIGVAVISRDITARKEAMEQVEKLSLQLAGKK